MFIYLSLMHHSSSALQQLDGLVLQLGSDATGGRLRFSLRGSLERIPVDILLLGALEQVDLARVVVMNEAPAASVDEFTGVGGVRLALAVTHVCNRDLAWRKQVDARNSLIANRDLALESTNVHTREVIEVLEERLVRSSDGQLHLGMLGEHTEVSHVGLNERQHLLASHPLG